MPRDPRPRRTGVLDKMDAEFLGTLYNNFECQFLIEHLGEPTAVALPEDEDLPDGICYEQVAPLLDRTHELDLYEQHLKETSGNPEVTVWVGFEKLKEVLQATLDWRAQVAELKRQTRGASPEVRRVAGAPSLMLWDAQTDVAYPGGVGADADIVRTAINEQGQREELFTQLRHGSGGSIRHIAQVAKFTKSRSAADVANRLMEGPGELLFSEGATSGLVTCPLCQKSEPFEMNKSSSKRKATDAILKHLMTESVTQVDAHRLLYKRLSTGRAGSRTNRVPARKRQGVDEAEAVNE